MRTSVQSTSVAAFHHHQESGKALQQQERILAFIERRGGNWSIGEIAKELGLEKSTVSARVNEMLNDTHDLVAAEKRKDRCSGVLVRPVALPPIQRGLF